MNMSFRLHKGIPLHPARFIVLIVAYILAALLIGALHTFSPLNSLAFVAISACPLAFVLLYGSSMVWGVLCGQTLLGLSIGLSVLQAFGLALFIAFEFLLFNLLSRRFDLSFSASKQRQFWVLSLITILLSFPSSAMMAWCFHGNGFFLGSGLGISLKTAFPVFLISSIAARTQLTPALSWLLVDSRRLLTPNFRHWLICILPCLIVALLMIAFLPADVPSQQGLGYKPLLFLVPLTIIVALQTNQFGLYCLYSSLMAFSLFSLFYLRVGNFFFDSELLITPPLRILAICWIGQAINFTLVQLLAARDLASERASQLANQLKISLLAASLTHEVKQPAAAIQMASRQLSTVSPHERDLLIESIILAADELGSSTAKVHGLLRSIPSGLKPLNLSEILALAVLREKVCLQQAHIALKVSSLDNPHWIMGDASQISLAIANMMRNSIYELEKLQDPIRRQITLSVVSTFSTVELMISDSGQGFHGQDFKPELFTSTKPEGTGLGLYLVQQMAENHQAQLLFGQSDLGGAQVKIIFPLLSNR